METKDLIDAFLNRDSSQQTNLLVDRCMAKDVIGSNPESIATTADFIKNSARTEDVISLQRIVMDYDEQKTKNFYYKFGLSVAERMVVDNVDHFADGLRDSVGAAKLKRPSKYASVRNIAISGLSASVKVAVNEGFSYFKRRLETNNEKILGLKIKEYMDRNDGDLSSLPLDDINETSRRLGLDTLFEVTEILPEVSPHARTEIIGSITERLSEAIARSNVESLTEDIGQNMSIENLIAEDYKIWSGLHEYAVETDSYFQEVSEGIEGIKLDLEDVSNTIATNSESIENLAFILSDSMSAPQKIQMIQLGLIEVQDPTQSIQKLENQIKREQIVDQVEFALKEGQALANIIEDLGGESDDLQNVMRVGGAAFSAYLNFQSGNYLTAASSLTGLFGGGESSGPDPQIMGFLKQISEKLEEMDRKLDKVLDNQKEMLQLLNDISAQIESAFENITQDILLLEASNLDDENTNLNGLKNLEEIEAGRSIDAMKGIFASYNDMQIQDKRSLSKYWEAFDVLSHSEFDGVQTALLATSHDSSAYEGSASDAFQKLIYLIRAYSDRYPNFPSNKLIASGLNPVSHIRDLNSKNTELASLNIPSTPYLDGVFKYVGKLVHTGYLGKVIERLINFHYIRAAYSTDGYSLRKPEQVLQEGINLTGRDWLKRAEELCDLAIAQQTILGGDSLLPLIYDLFQAGLTVPLDTDPDVELKNLTLETLKNPHLSILRQNVGLYFIRQNLADNFKMGNVVQKKYREALEMNALRYRSLHSYLGTSGQNHDFLTGPIMDIVPDEEAIDFNREQIRHLDQSANNRQFNTHSMASIFVSEDLYIPLPPSERVSDRSIHQLYSSDSLPYLLSLKETLQEHLSTYNFSNRDGLTNSIYSQIMFS